jgi:2-C-methyl-D-erythritol 4-phosphate cytidylyltransferase
LQSPQPKAFVQLAGLSLLAHSALALSSVVDVIVVAVPDGETSRAAIELENVDAQIHIVTGGANRQESVAACLAVLPENVDIVLVHDAARPLVPVDVVGDVVAAVRQGDQAVVPVLPLVDTIKRVNTEGDIIETIDREQLRRVQTPQGFTREVLMHAYADPTHVATDDAGLVESLGVTVTTVAGSERGLKITTQEDFVHALSLLGSTNE